MAGKLSRDELVELFWESDAPQELSKFCTGYVCHFYRELPAPPISYQPSLEDGDLLFDLSKVYPEKVTFFLDGRPFAETMYLAVVCEGHVIVPPFRLSDREKLPTMFHKEASVAATPEPTETARATA